MALTDLLFRVLDAIFWVEEQVAHVLGREKIPPEEAFGDK